MTFTNDLAHKVAIITGAGRGIGKATAHLFAAAGAAVVLAARNAPEIQLVAESIKANGGQALAIPTDITDPAAIDQLIILTLRAFKHIDILVNNAAVITPIGKVWEVSHVEWQALITVNVIGPYLCCRAALPHMLDRGDGVIINVTSGAAAKNIAGWSAYCASKSALDRFTGVLAEEVAHTGIVVNGMDPGPTRTDMQAQAQRNHRTAFPAVKQPGEQPERKRLFQPEEAAQLNLWLASGRAASGRIFALPDESVRRQIAQDLKLPVIPNRS